MSIFEWFLNTRLYIFWGDKIKFDFRKGLKDKHNRNKELTEKAWYLTSQWISNELAFETCIVLSGPKRFVKSQSISNEDALLCAAAAAGGQTECQWQVICLSLLSSAHSINYHKTTRRRKVTTTNNLWKNRMKRRRKASSSSIFPSLHCWHYIF